MPILIRTRQGASGTRFQVIVRSPATKESSRTFRHMNEAKNWAAQEEKRLRAAQKAAAAFGDTDILD